MLSTTNEAPSSSNILKRRLTPLQLISNLTAPTNKIQVDKKHHEQEDNMYFGFLVCTNP